MFLCTVATLPLLTFSPLSALAQVVQPTEWTGAVSNDWSDAANWSAGIPDNTLTAVITSVGPVNDPKIGSSVSADVVRIWIDQGNDLTVSDGGTLIVSDLISIGRSAQINDPSGALSVLAGGTVEANRIFLGDGINGGSTEVSGVGSTLTAHLADIGAGLNDVRFVVGGWGDGDLTVSDGGVVSAGGTGLLELGNNFLGRAATGTLKIGEGGLAGNINASEIRFNTATSSIVANFTDELILSSVISGSGSLYQEGSGKLTLTGMNTYTGGTDISSGATLQIGDGGTAGSISDNVHNDGTLIFNRSDDLTYAGEITGAGTAEFVQAGTGSLKLTGDSSAFAGSTVVQHGSLIVGDNFGAGRLGGDVSVLSGARLGGSGTIGASGSLVNIGSGATLAAGNSIGTLSVAGNLALDAGSLFEVEVNNGGNVAGVNNDTTSVAGDVTISSGSTVRVLAENRTDDGSTYAPNTSYTILSYSGTRSGTFNSTVDENFAFLDASLDYSANAVLLNLTRNDITFVDVSKTPNQSAVANALAAFDTTSDVYQRMMGLTEDEARTAYDGMSGEIHAAGQYMSFGSLNLFGSTLGSRTSVDRNRVAAPTGGSALGYVSTASAVSAATAAINAVDHTALAPVSSYWFSPIGGRGSVNGDGNGADFDWSAAGVATGYETVLPTDSGNLTVGFGMGYLASWSDSNARQSSSDSQGGYLGFYADWVNGPLTVSGQVAYGLSRVSTSRDINIGGLVTNAEADYWSHNFGLRLETSYALMLSEGLTVSPIATLSVAWSGHGGFNENGAGALSAQVSSDRNWRVDTGLGFEMAHQTILEDGGALKASGRVLWGHRVGSMASDATITLAGGGAPFQISAAEADRDRLLVGAGLAYNPSDRMTLSLDYAGEFGEATDNHSGKIGIKVAF